jgi:hypothetical protein
MLVALLEQLMVVGMIMYMKLRLMILREAYGRPLTISPTIPS